MWGLSNIMYGINSGMCSISLFFPSSLMFDFYIYISLKDIDYVANSQYLLKRYK